MLFKSKQIVTALGAGALFFSLLPQTKAQETIGGGTVFSPAQGPAPSYGLGGPNMALVKNWHFGTNGTIKNYADMSANFFYHDEFGTMNNGSNYGSNTVSPDFGDSIGGQPIEGVNSPTVRQFNSDSLTTYITPLNGTTTIQPWNHNAGNGSFMAKWRLPNGGSLLGRDIVWETRVRMVTPPYFWFALWTAGNAWKWDGTNGQGAEHDLVESFGYDNGGVNNTNYDGRYWHSNTVASPSKDSIDYWNGWTTPMVNAGFPSFDATQYHTWTWVYKRDNTFAMYCDGKRVQYGSNYYWTYGNTATDPPVDMDFLFDAAWGHNKVGSVDKTLDVSQLAGKYYEFNYSRVYLSTDGEAAYNGPHTLPGVVLSSDYDTGGQGLAYNQTVNGGQTGFRSDNSSADYGGGLGWTAAGQWYKYTVLLQTGGSYVLTVNVASPIGGGRFHVEDEKGVNLTGTMTVPNTGSWGDTGVTITAPLTLSSGGHILKVVQDSNNFNLNAMTFSQSSAAGATCAAYVKTDNTTQGTWKGVYGSDGYWIVNDNSGTNPKNPSYGSTSTNAWMVTWVGSTSDVRGLQKINGSDRIAAQLGGDPFDIDCNLTDGNTHQVALYALDWDLGARNEVIQVRDAATGTVLDTQTVDTFVNGSYFIWKIKGHVTFHVMNHGGSTTALAGVFFDPSSSVVTGIPEGTYKILAKTSGMALDCSGCSSANGTTVGLWGYWNGSCQHWNIHNLGNGNYSIRTINSDGSVGRSLDCTGCSPNNGTQLQLWDYSGANCQQWAITQQPDGAYAIATAQANSSGNRDVLDGSGCSGAQGTSVILWSWNGYPNPCQQEWNIAAP